MDAVAVSAHLTLATDGTSAWREPGGEAPRMAYIPSWQELRDHPKTLRAARALDVRRTSVIGMLHCLWWWALDYASDGDLTGFDDADIAAAAEWEGDPAAFVEALAGCGVAGRPGFLDEHETGYGLHDWEDYGGKFVEQRARDAQRKRDVRATSGGRPSDVRAMSASRGTKTREEEQGQHHSQAALADEPDGPGIGPGGMPLRADPNDTYVRTLARWARSNGLDLKQGGPRDTRYRNLLTFVAAHLGADHPALHSVSMGVIVDYVHAVTDTDVHPAARSHLAQLVKIHGPRPAFDGIAQALVWGAGLNPAHAADVQALTKYATTVILAQEPTP